MPVLYGVGVGPGDPELLTLKAVRILGRVPVVFHPAAGGEGEGVALGIVRGVLGPKARIVASVLAAGGEGAFVTEGDPLLYSTFQHLLAALPEEAPEVRIEVVPGVSAMTAAAAAARFPLVRGAERLAVLPASRVLADDPSMLLRVLEEYDAVVLLKVARVFDRVLPVLQQARCEAVLVERCGMPGERIVDDPASLAGERLDYFSLLLVRRAPS